ncbi:peptide-methionine (S)-S-oxide reductase MsrA [bacterium]|nr:peptide-methionine (S)-S-oxide reductase MsrA [bacterium]
MLILLFALGNVGAGARVTEKATFGGGCFWCLEAVFEDLKGVASVTSGYAGGAQANPTYEAVCSGQTGHAEVIQVEFDPVILSYQDLMKIFFTMHDPTTPNQQGADRGTQYRSIVLYESPAQKVAAEAARKEAQGHYRSPIVTEIVPLTKFYGAEGYHQGYYKLNTKKPYCSAVIAPKVKKMRETFGSLLK